MGQNKYQIATVDNLHQLYRYGFTGTSGYCPKYSAITAKSWYTVKFNSETETKPMNFNICPAYYNWYNTGYSTADAQLFCKVISGSSSSVYDSANIPIALYYGTNQMYVFNKNDIYGQQGTTVALSGSYLLNSSNPNTVKYGCLARASLSLTAGFNLTGNLNVSCGPVYATSLSGYSDGLGADHTSIGSHTSASPSVNSPAWWLAVVGPDGLVTQYSASIVSASFTFNFSVDKTGTYYFCLIPNYIEWRTQYNQNISGYVYNGVYLYFTGTPTASLPSRSYSSNMLVRYMDISIVTTRKLTVKIYNNKSSKAKLNNIYAYYDTSTAETTAGTRCGGLSIGEVAKNSTASYSLPITIPASIINSSNGTYYVHIYCGATDVKQTWSYKFTSTGTYSSTKKDKSRVTTGIQVCRRVSTNTAQFILPNIYGSSPMSEMTFQIK